MTGHPAERATEEDRRRPARVRSTERRPRPGRTGAGVGCLVLLGLTLAALAHVAVQARHLDVALALGQEQKVQADLLEQRRRLKSAIARLKDPGLISALARDRLHMAAVDPSDIRAPRRAEAVSGAEGRR
jgi:cell division protein FtsL